MSKLRTIPVLLFLIALGSCNTPEKRGSDLSMADSIDVARRAKRMTDSIINEARLKATSELKKKAASSSPAVVTKSRITEDEYGSKSLRVTIRNKSAKTIDGIKVRWVSKDNFGEQVTDTYDGGQVQELLRPQRSATYYFKIYSSLATKMEAFVTDVHFTDGTKWSAAQASIAYN